MVKATAGPDRGVLSSAPRRPGFTLIELLVVIMILALVIAIILPALAGARTMAKGGATRAFMGEIMKASESWRLDKQGKAPGYFSARDMGCTENAARGMTAMQNVGLDLLGAMVDKADPNLGADDPKEIGPRNDPTTHVAVNIGLMGSKTGYFSPDGRYLKAQDNGLANQKGEGFLVGADDHKRLPSLVDSWGNPLLLWAEDPTAIGAVTLPDQFAREDSGPGDKIAKFYWASNAGLLNSTSLGKTGKNQTYVGVDTEYSLIGGGVPAADLEKSLIGILGNPSYPSNLAPPLVDVVPTQARGRMVIESAGPDAVYFGSRDKGYNRIDHAGPEFKEGVITYLNNFFFNNGSLTRFTDDKGNPTTESVTDKFDEILVSGGN